MIDIPDGCTLKEEVGQFDYIGFHTEAWYDSAQQGMPFALVVASGDRRNFITVLIGEVKEFKNQIGLYAYQLAVAMRDLGMLEVRNFTEYVLNS